MGMSPNERPPKEDGSNVIRHPGVCHQGRLRFCLTRLTRTAFNVTINLTSSSHVKTSHVSDVRFINWKSCFLEIFYNLRFFVWMDSYQPTSPGFPCITKSSIATCDSQSSGKARVEHANGKWWKTWIFSWHRKGWSIVVDLLSKMSLAANAEKKKKQRRICPSNFQITSVLHIFSVLHFDSFMREYLEVLNNFCKTWEQANCFRTSTLRYFNETPCVTDD